MVRRCRGYETRPPGPLSLTPATTFLGGQEWKMRLEVPAAVARWVMICTAISQESRKAALAELQRAARECDLLEVCLDRFGRAPGIADFVAAQPKPILF